MFSLLNSITRAVRYNNLPISWPLRSLSQQVYFNKTTKYATRDYFQRFNAPRGEAFNKSALGWNDLALDWNNPTLHWARYEAPIDVCDRIVRSKNLEKLYNHDTIAVLMKRVEEWKAAELKAATKEGSLKRKASAIDPKTATAVSDSSIMSSQKTKKKSDIELKGSIEQHGGIVDKSEEEDIADLFITFYDKLVRGQKKVFSDSLKFLLENPHKSIGASSFLDKNDKAYLRQIRAIIKDMGIKNMGLPGFEITTSSRQARGGYPPKLMSIQPKYHKAYKQLLEQRMLSPSQ